MVQVLIATLSQPEFARCMVAYMEAQIPGVEIAPLFSSDAKVYQSYERFKQLREADYVIVLGDLTSERCVELGYRFAVSQLLGKPAGVYLVYQKDAEEIFSVPYTHWARVIEQGHWRIVIDEIQRDLRVRKQDEPKPSQTESKAPAGSS